MSPGGQTPLLLWCLFSAAYADSPAEEEGREEIKRAERNKGGRVRRRKTIKMKLIKKFNKRRKSVMNRKSKSCLLKER